MKLDFGPDIFKPTLAVTLSRAEEAKLDADAGAMEALEQLAAAREVDYETDDDTSRLHFRLRAIGRRREAVHEQRLGRVVRVLSGLSGYNYSPADDQELRALSFGEARSHAEGGVSLAAELVLPDVDDQRLSNFTTRVMQGMARQLRYEQRIGRRKGRYTGFIFAAIDRRETRGGGGVRLETNPRTKAHMSLEQIDSLPERPVVNLAAHNLVTHKQQLICLAGIAAITHAEDRLA